MVKPGSAVNSPGSQCRRHTRRPGDIDSCYADPAKAQAEIGWRATRDLDAMCADSWRWQSLNPRGFDAA